MPAEAPARAPRRRRSRLLDPMADPFGEATPVRTRPPINLLGTTFHFEATDAVLLGLVDDAYRRLPAHRLPGATRQARVRLVLTEDRPGNRWIEPPPVQTHGGGGVLSGTSDGSNYVCVSPATPAALVAVSPRMLAHRYHARYELLEFAVFTLATRVRSLVPLHAASVGAAGRALLLIGDSGAGKSTLALHALLGGLEFLSEDSSFVSPSGLLVSGIANYLHLRRDALRGVASDEQRARLAAFPVIRRRSGVEKIEVDARALGGRLVPAPARLRGIVFLSSKRGDPPLRRLGRETALARLVASQPFAANAPGWPDFLRRAARLPLFELRRAHPETGVAALRALLGAAPAGGRRRRAAPR